MAVREGTFGLRRKMSQADEGGREEHSRQNRQHIERPCGRKEQGTLKKSEQGLWNLESEEQRRGLGWRIKQAGEKADWDGFRRKTWSSGKEGLPFFLAFIIYQVLC